MDNQHENLNLNLWGKKWKRWNCSQEARALDMVMASKKVEITKLKEMMNTNLFFQCFSKEMSLLIFITLANYIRMWELCSTITFINNITKILISLIF